MTEHVYGFLRSCVMVVIGFSLLLSFYAEVGEGAVLIDPWVAAPLLVIAVCVHIGMQNESQTSSEKE